MLRLSRTVRFSACAGAPPALDARPDNGYAGYPSMHGLGAHYELDIACVGEAAPPEGYCMDIKQIDRAARAVAIPRILDAVRRDPAQDPAPLLARVVGPLDDAIGGRLASLRWRLSPYYSVEMSAADTATALLRQRFEFAASHRLNVPSLSPEENRRLFGKCNHAAGHGHNYVVEPCVAVRLDPGAQRFGLQALERIVDGAIIQRFDHRHLNVDVPEFAEPDGLNPTVENIARVCFALLEHQVRAAGASLHSVTVWETEKTSCTYPA